MSADRTSSVDLYWIPLGAGARVVRASGWCFEALAAFVGRRERCDLYHSALRVTTPDGSFVIEMTPVPNGDGVTRGVVAEGAVGTSWAGRFRILRYEIRCWRDGRIPDLASAVDGPRRLTGDDDRAQQVLRVVNDVPTSVWGRDELDAGEMWNSNSVTSWTLATAGFDLSAVRPPEAGRAPGWEAGVVVAARHRLVAPEDR
jgi:hypothetical protein